jgi:hypothetical protein
MKKNPPKTIQTRKDEIRLTTDSLEKMLDMYTVKDVRRSWEEDFIDEGSGEVISITRSEMIVPAGTLLDKFTLQKLQFFMQSGEITEVEVSNQSRKAKIVNSSLTPYYVTAKINQLKGKCNLLLYAQSCEMALEIAKDYIELNFESRFYFTQVKVFDSCIFIEKVIDEKAAEKHFYKIDTTANFGNYEQSYVFVVRAKDVDTAMISINDYLIEIQKKNEQSIEDLKITLNSAIIIPCSRVIESEFSIAYISNEG